EVGALPTPSASLRRLVPLHPKPSTNRKMYEARHPLSKAVALPQELQTKPSHPNPTRSEAEPRVPPFACWSTTENHMNTKHIEIKFATMGARFRVSVASANRSLSNSRAIRLRLSGAGR